MRLGGSCIQIIPDNEVKNVKDHQRHCGKKTVRVPQKEKIIINLSEKVSVKFLASFL